MIGEAAIDRRCCELAVPESLVVFWRFASPSLGREALTTDMS
jgi:hypothetical protein